ELVLLLDHRHRAGQVHAIDVGQEVHDAEQTDDDIGGTQQALLHDVVTSCCAVSARNPIASCVPPGRCGTFATRSPISTPASVPISVRSLKSPRWPMRKILPASLPRPVPSDMS